MEENEFFINEAQAHIIKGENDIILFEKDPHNVQIISELKFVFQALSLLATTIGLENASLYCKDFEVFLEEAKNMQKVLDKPESFINLILKGFEDLRSIINNYTNGKITDINKEVITNLKTLIEDFKSEFEITFINPIPIHKIDFIINDRENKFYKIHIFIEPTCKFKKVRLFFIFRALNKIGRLCWSNPDPATLEKGEFDLDFEVFYITKEKSDVILHALDEILEIKKKTIYELNSKKFETLIKKINIKEQKEYLEKASEDLIKETGANEDLEIPIELKKIDIKNIKFIFTNSIDANNKTISIPSIHFLSLINQNNNNLVFYTYKNVDQNEYFLYLINQGFILTCEDNDFEFFEKAFEIQKKGYTNFFEFLEATKYSIENAETYKKFKKSKSFDSNIKSYYEYLKNKY